MFHDDDGEEAVSSARSLAILEKILTHTSWIRLWQSLKYLQKNVCVCVLTGHFLKARIYNSTLGEVVSGMFYICGCTVQSLAVWDSTHCFCTCVLGTVILVTATADVILWHHTLTFKYVAGCHNSDNYQRHNTYHMQLWRKNMPAHLLTRWYLQVFTQF